MNQLFGKGPGMKRTKLHRKIEETKENVQAKV
jgi:hypothetical protein